VRILRWTSGRPNTSGDIELPYASKRKVLACSAANPWRKLFFTLRSLGVLALKKTYELFLCRLRDTVACLFVAKIKVACVDVLQAFSY